MKTMRAISDTERREVAEKLRSESETWRDTFPSATIEEEAFGAAIMSDLMVFVGLEDESPVHAIYARLADLIDLPTCHDVSSFNDVFKCSECGVSLDDLTAEVGSADFMPLYCPACGAEVIDDD